MATWNAAALLHRDPKKRAGRRKVLSSLLERASILAIQEVHGGDGSLEQLCPELVRGRFLHSSRGASWASGGVATSFDKRVFPINVVDSCVELVPGRVILSRFRADGYTIFVLNIHKFDIDSSAFASMAHELADVAAQVERDIKCSFFVLGDMNSMAAGDRYSYVESGQECAPSSAATAVGKR